MADDTKKKSLSDSDITSRRGLGRRAFILGSFGGTAALAGCVSTGVTDADVGAYSDPVGAGRGGRRVTGITDSDGGSNADPAGNGRGRRMSGVTDSDTGFSADPVGNGRMRSCTDSDLGPIITDPAGRGRRC